MSHINSNDKLRLSKILWPLRPRPEISGAAIVLGYGTTLGQIVAEGGLRRVDMVADDALAAILTAAYGRAIVRDHDSVHAIKSAARHLLAGRFGLAVEALGAVRLGEIEAEGAEQLFKVDALIRSGIAPHIALGQISPKLSLAKYDPDEPRDAHGRWTNGGQPKSTMSSAVVLASAERRAKADRATSAMGHGKHVSIQYSDGTTEDRVGGTHAWRANNPGNIMPGDFANRHGAIGDDGTRAIFPDEETGTRAQEALLRGPTYSGKTVDEAVRNWAPPEAGNDTARYQLAVHQWAGLTGDERIGDLTSDQLHLLMAAQRRMEGWSPGTITRSRSA